MTQVLLVDPDIRNIGAYALSDEGYLAKSFELETLLKRVATVVGKYPRAQGQ